MTGPSITLNYEVVGYPNWNNIADKLDADCHVICTRSGCCFRMVADQIREQIKPPKPEEPELWGVVEGRDGNRWVRVSDLGVLRWRHIGPVDRSTSWDGITENYGPVKVLSEGVATS